MSFTTHPNELTTHPLANCVMIHTGIKWVPIHTTQAVSMNENPSTN